VGQGNHRYNPKIRRTYETTKGHGAWRVMVLRAATVAMREQGHRMITGPVMLELVFAFPRPKSHVLKSGGLAKGAPAHKTSSPDLSKLIRCVEDSLTDAKVWTDDSYVVEVKAVKRYATHGEAIGAKVWVAPW
jgi:Holliday junction resolvase RusA-like endonuclease